SGRSQDRLLDTFPFPSSDRSGGRPHSVSATVADAGSALHVQLTLAAPVPDRSDDQIPMGAFTITEDGPCQTVMRVYSSGHSSNSGCGGYAVASGSTVDIYVPKVGLRLGKQFSWGAGVGGEDLEPRDVKSPASTRGAVDFSAPPAAASGNIYEV